MPYTHKLIPNPFLLLSVTIKVTRINMVDLGKTYPKVVIA